MKWWRFLLESGAIDTAVMQRESFAVQVGITARFWTPQTLRSAVNGLAHAHRQTRPPLGIVASAEQQFPKYCLTFNEALLRSRKTKALQEHVGVLTDAEVLSLYDATNWASPYEAQRMNMLILSFNLGQRPDNIYQLQVGNLRLLRDEVGDPVLEVTMPGCSDLTE